MDPFSVFSKNSNNFTTNNYRDLNSRPLDHQSPPVTSRPVLHLIFMNWYNGDQKLVNQDLVF